MLTVVVVTKNEVNMIRTCLESIKWTDEIIIVDNGSIDKTLEIAKLYTDKIFKFEGQDYAQMRNLAMEKAQGDWVFYVDADERVLLPLKEEILNTIQDTKFSAFAVKRNNIIFGQEVNYGMYQKDFMIRLLKRSSFESWIGKIHEYAKFKGELGYLKNPLLHLTHRDLDQVVLKSLHWSNFDAQLRIDANHPKMSGWRFIRILKTELFKQLIIRRGLFGGTIGVIDSLLQVFSLLMSYIRLWEMQRSESLDETYRKIDEKLTKEGFKS